MLGGRVPFANLVIIDFGRFKSWESELASFELIFEAASMAQDTPQLL